MKEIHMANTLIRHDFNHNRPHVAVASMDGESINQPLGNALSLLIYRASALDPELVERRTISNPQQRVEEVDGIGKDPLRLRLAFGTRYRRDSL